MYLNTRDLAEEREELKQSILDSFLENFPHYEDMTESFEDIRFEEEEIESWKEDWITELELINDIDRLEEEINSYSGDNFDDGVTLIEEDDFEEYCEELITDCGYISRDFPSWIIIDWEATASNVRQDYSEVDYQGRTYLFRA